MTASFCTNCGAMKQPLANGIPHYCKETPNKTMSASEVESLRRDLMERVEVGFNYSRSVEQVKGNAMASGDDALDLTVETEIIRRLNQGDFAAWFDVECRVSFAGIHASSYLAACSYESFEAFEACDYAKDLKTDAVDDLTRVIGKVLELRDGMKPLIEGSA